MARRIESVTVDFINPADRSQTSYTGLYESRSAPGSRRYQRVLLISPPAILFRGDLPRCTYPLGPGYIGAMLLKDGYDAAIVDCLAAGYYTTSMVDEAGDFIRYGLTADELAARIVDFTPDVIGVSSIFSNQTDVIEEAFRTARAVAPDALLVTGGAHARYFPQQYIDDLQADAVFLGEAENSFLEFMDFVNGCVPMEALRGIVLGRRLSTAGGFTNKEMPLIRAVSSRRESSGELDAIPFPAWHLYDMERYFSIGAYQSPYTVGQRVAQIYTSRGCTAKCTFCTTTNFWGGKLRRRSASNVMQELRLLVERYGVDEFHVQDDNITNDLRHARLLFAELKEIDLPWCTPQGTALWRMDESLLDDMRASGCYQVTFAIESGVQRVLDQLIKKPLDLAKTTHLVRYARSIGLRVHGFFIIGMPPMFGHPGETIDEMKRSFDYAQSAGFHSASFFTATPIIGSELLTECLRNGFIASDTELYRMSYKQGLIDVPGLWSGRDIAALAARFNRDFNAADARNTRRVWAEQQY